MQKGYILNVIFKMQNQIIFYIFIYEMSSLFRQVYKGEPTYKHIPNYHIISQTYTSKYS